MSFQLILGASGAGKSHYMYKKIIDESVKNQHLNYILLVPEQYSMLLQRKMVTLHPSGGTMNIDVIGFNRLAYRIFDEQSVKTSKVLEDFGKSMLIRQVAGEVKDSLKIYGNSLDKPGFIDEVKSLMSEFYQYDLGHGKIEKILEALKENNEEDTLLGKKLADMSVIFDAFSKRIGEEYIVAEEITELLAEYIDNSELIKNSVIVMDGFTGFTPIQLNVVEKLMKNAIKVYGIFTIDRQHFEKKNVRQHELFYLTRQTMSALKERAIKGCVELCEDIFVEGSGYGKSDEISHLERNIFRYPYEQYKENCKKINISSYVNLRQEISGVANEIRRLVINEGYRYKDFAVITGNFEETEEVAKHIFSKYDIPFFMDYSRPVKNNPYIDAICNLIRAVGDNFSYDAVFAFIKSGIFSEIGYDDVENLENYVIAHGIKGFWRWNKKWEDESDFAREYIVELAAPFIKDGQPVKKDSVKGFTGRVKDFMDKLSYETMLSEKAEQLLGEADIEMSKLYGMLYEKICELLDKMELIMGDAIVDINDFDELFALGLKDLSLGIIPTCLDMVTVGDITRTRLDGVKALFILDANEGILSAKTSSTQIISDREKEKLFEMGFELADTEKQSAYVEQFYLYLNMTKPKDRLYISYMTVNLDNEAMRPSYIIKRICNIFPRLEIGSGEGETDEFYGTREAGVDVLIDKMKNVMGKAAEKADDAYGMYRLYYDNGDSRILDIIKEGLAYNNLPTALSGEVLDLVRVRLMSVSVSVIEQYAKCAYGYFLKYVLGIRERATNNLDDRNIGIVLHDLMQRIYRHVHDNLDNGWDTLEASVREKMVDDFVDNIFESGLDITDKKTLYMKNVIKRIGKRITEVLCEELSKSTLKPEYFEYRFNRDIGENIKLTGIVDRGDVYYNEEEGQLKIRIIDYKSGNYDFNINELYEGLQLQLSVYMNMMLELAGEKYKEKVKVIPEGMFYFQMQDPFIDVKSEADARIHDERNKKIKLKGEADDSERIRNYSEFAIRKTKAIADEILRGKFNKNPFYNGDRTVCGYCPYKDVCRFDNKNGANKYRYRRYKDADKELIYEKIVEELGGDK